MRKMSFIKRNKITLIAIIIFLILVLGLFQIKNIFFPEEGSAIYGNRLEGIETVEITKQTKEEVKTKLDETVTSTEVRVAGRLVNISLTVANDVSKDTAKSYANKALEAFSEEQKKYYDFQIFIKKDMETQEFPIIGYRHHNKDGFTWTKDRTETNS